jgi:hypothetical protein
VLEATPREGEVRMGDGFEYRRGRWHGVGAFFRGLFVWDDGHEHA